MKGSKDLISERIIELILLNAPAESRCQLTDETRLMEDLDYESIAIMSLLVDVEEEFGFEADNMEESLKAFETVGSFVEFVRNNIQK